jgi:MoaA/NifB/PqqE/SkfB family radical SAM enzyme
MTKEISIDGEANKFRGEGGSWGAVDNKVPFCAEPFQHFEINRHGDVYVCCPGWLPKSIGNLENDTLMNIWNSKSAQEIRRTILDGSFEYCRKEFCPYLSNKSLPTQSEVKQAYSKKLIATSAVVMAKGPQEVNLGYDRSCNLYCRSCRSHIVHLRDEELKKARIIQEKIFHSDLEKVERIIVSGHGDPFGSKLYRELLLRLDSKQFPSLKIRLFSNGILFTPNLWNKLHKIHSGIDEVYISVDAARKETYEKLRRGGKFDILVKNLAFIGQLRRNNDIAFFRLSFVVQKDNYREMKQFVNMGEKYGADVVYFSQIRNWGTYTPTQFAGVAVHESDHPEHAELVRTLQDPSFRNKRVRLNTLEKLLRFDVDKEKKTDEGELPAYQKNTVEKLFEYLPKNAKTVLEIGSDLNCGVIKAIGRRFNGQVYGLNPSPGFTCKAGTKRSNVVPLKADGERLPFSDNSVGSVLSIATLEHVDDVAQFLYECHRVLEKGGIFYTFFGPIWSCAVGHHVCAKIPGKEARFWKPGKNPLPDFSHLLMTEDDMRDFLRSGPCDNRLIGPIIDWVYRKNNGDHVNRLFYEDYKRVFEESPFKIRLFRGAERSLNLPPNAETRRKLENKYGKDKNFLYATIEAVCEKVDLY